MMQRTVWYTVGLVVLSGLLAGIGCQRTTISPPTTPSTTPTNLLGVATPSSRPALTVEEANAQRAGIAELGFDLFAKLAPQDPTTNLVISPYGLWSALVPVSEAARGRTAEELVRVLRLRPEHRSPWDKVAHLDRELDGLQPVDGVLKSRRGLWVRPTTQPDPTYWTLAEEANTTTGQLDFAGNPTAAAGTVNQWASQSTEGRVKEVLSAEAAADLQVLAASSVFLRGRWDSPFRPARTRAEPWKRPGRQRDARMMIHTLTAAATEAGGVKALDLPLAGGQVVVTFLLPAPGSDVNRFASQLTAETYQTYRAEMKTQPVELGLPSFETQTQTDLAAALKMLGAGRVFTPDAELPAFGSPKVTLTRALIASSVKVDEQGLVAAAVTTIGGSARSAVENPFVFFADRPFLFVVQAGQPGVILFIGRVQEPDLMGN